MPAATTPEAFLAEPQVCVLATVNPDGTPHAMPMWYAFEDGVIWFMSGPKSQKCRNIERTGQATVVVDRREVPYYAVMAKCEAAIGPTLESALNRRLIRRYLDEQGTDDYIASKMSPENVGIRLTPTKFVEFSGRAGS